MDMETDLLSNFNLFDTLLFLSLIFKSKFLFKHKCSQLLKDLECAFRIANFYLAEEISR